MERRTDMGDYWLVETLADPTPDDPTERWYAHEEYKPGTPQYNLKDLQAKADQALQVNTDYLIIADAASNIQVRQQVKVLTRECSGLIRLLRSKLDSVEGT